MTTVAESLQHHGWNTAAISFNPGIRTELDFDQGFDSFDEYLGKLTAYPPMEEMIGRVETWLQDLPKEPFFLYLQPMDIHGPYRVPKEARTAVIGRIPSQDFRYYHHPMCAILNEGKVELRDQVDNSYLESLNDKYDPAVRYSTDQLAELFSLMARHGLYDDALIIVTADHREELFDHGGFSHGFSLHRESLHVPLFIKLPGQTQGGVVESGVNLIDLYPTILEVSGIEADPNLDGSSVVSLIQGQEAPEPDQERERLTQTAWEGRCVARGISSQGFRLIEIERNYEGAEHRTRLYDLTADPLEPNDISAQHAQIARDLRQRLQHRFDQLNLLARPQPLNRKDQLDQDRLKALGYVE